MRSSSRALSIGAPVLAVALLAGCGSSASAPQTASSQSAGPQSPSPSPTIEDVGPSTTIAGIEVGPSDGYIDASAPVQELRTTSSIGRLDPTLRSALVDAADAAARGGVRVEINSAWRSERYQRALLDQAVEEYGSVEAARRWVDTPERSAHTRGAAVDVGPAEAWEWLLAHGAEYGLCQTLANEAWHFERATEPGGECPAMHDDAAARPDADG